MQGWDSTFTGTRVTDSVRLFLNNDLTVNAPKGTVSPQSQSPPADQPEPSIGGIQCLWLLYAKKKDGDRRQGKSRRVCLGGRIYSIPLPRYSWFASVDLKE